MSYENENEEQDRAFSLPGLSQLASSAGGASGGAGPLQSLAHNPVVNAAVNLQRRHPGEMVFLEVAAAGALLYGHNKRKERQEQYRQEAEEDLKRRGWDGGAKRDQEDHLRRQNSGLQVPGATGGPPRPLSAPPKPAWQAGPGQSRGGDDDLAYGNYTPPPGPPPNYGMPPGRDDGLAYGKSYQNPPADQPYLPPSGPRPGWQGPPQQQYPPQQYGTPPPGQWQQQQSWGPGGPPPQQAYAPYPGPPPQQGQHWGPPPQGQPHGYYPAPGPY